MDNKIFIEENKVYKINFNKAIWATDKLHDIFHAAGVSLLSDVDFIADTGDCFLIVEYKNANVPNAANPDAFKPLEDKVLSKIAYKYYDSLIYLMAKGKTNKVFQFVYILEYPKGDSVTRKAIRNKIMDRLPFKLQANEEFQFKLIEKLEVLSIDEWNIHPNYSIFPISKVDNT